MEKIRVLQFPVANSKGGITQYVLQNWKYIDKTRFHFDFATMSKELSFADELEKSGSKIYYISCYAEENKQQFIREFEKILTENNYDIVHLHTKQWKSFLVEEIAKKAKVKKIIVHAHSTGIDKLDSKNREYEEKLHYATMEKLNENIATDFWSCSWKAADFIFGNKIRKERIKIMNNAIDVQKYCFNEQVRIQYRKELGIEDNFVIGNVGRFVYQKNQEFLLEIFERLLAINNKFKLLFIGNGERENEYRKFVEEHNLIGNVLFLGQRQDVNYLLSAMDCFCFPSRFEGFGIALIEAQVAGLQCICGSNIPKEAILTEYVDVLPLQKELWIDKICSLFSNFTLEVKDKRTECRKEVKKNGYDILEQIREIERYYQQEI